MADTGNLHVVLGTGQLGRAVIDSLAADGKRVRAVGRSRKHSVPGGVEHVMADLADKSSAVRACAGASTVYHCASPPYGRWTELMAPLMETIIESAAETGAKLVFGDNVYMYGEVEGPITENLPNNATGPKGRVRAKAAFTLMEAHKAGRLRATIGRGSDFFGPGVRSAIMGQQVFAPAIKGKSVSLLGDPDIPHSFTFIEDFARALILLGERDDALGQIWHVPNDRAVTPFHFVEMIYDEAGRKPRVHVVPRWLFNLMSLFSPLMRELKETDYQRSKPFVVDSSNFTSTFHVPPTPLKESIRKTVEWYRKHL